MRRVCLDDNRAAGGECRCRIAAGRRECEREIARAKNDNRANRLQHAPYIRARRRLPLRQRRIDACIDPRTFAHGRREEPQLSAGTAALAGDPRGRQAGLGQRAFDQYIAEGLDLSGDRLEKASALFGRSTPIVGKRSCCCIERSTRFSRGRLVKCRLELFTGRRIECVEGFAKRTIELSGNDAFTMQSHLRSWRPVS
jgi:hypothetical protein